MAKYKYLLFDVDDTLFDFHKAEEKSFYQVMNEFGIKADDRMLHDYSLFNKSCWEEFQEGRNDQKSIVVKRFKLLLDHYGYVRDATAMNEAFLRAVSQNTCLFPESYEVCKRLSKTHALYMITNSVPSVHRGRMEHNVLKDFFRDMFISGEIGYQKPSPEFFDAVFSTVEGMEKKDTLVIGDSPTSDLQGANACNIDCCFVNRSGISLPESISATYTVSDLNGLFDIV